MPPKQSRAAKKLGLESAFVLETESLKKKHLELLTAMANLRSRPGSVLEFGLVSELEALLLSAQEFTDDLESLIHLAKEVREEMGKVLGLPTRPA